jgi:anti-anti-sigma factor
MEMEFSELDGNVDKVALHGRLDRPGADRVEARFGAAMSRVGRDVVVDISGVGFLASMGMRMLITAARTKNRAGRRIVLFGPQPLVKEVLDHVSLTEIVPIAADEHEALRVLQS